MSDWDEEPLSLLTADEKKELSKRIHPSRQGRVLFGDQLVGVRKRLAYEILAERDQ